MILPIINIIIYHISPNSMSDLYNSKEPPETYSTNVPFPKPLEKEDKIIQINLKMCANDPHVDIKKIICLMLIESGDLKDIVHNCDICNTEIKDNHMYKCPKCMFFDACVACHYDLYNNQNSEIMSPCGHLWNEYKLVENSFEQFSENLKQNKDVIINIESIMDKRVLIQSLLSGDDTIHDNEEASSEYDSISEDEVLEIDI